MMPPSENTELALDSQLPEGVEVDCDLPYTVKIGKRASTIRVDSDEMGGIVVRAPKGEEVHVIRGGDGDGDCVLEGECKGNATREGPGHGHAVKMGGSGHAFKIGTGIGEARSKESVGMRVKCPYPITLKQSALAPGLWELRAEAVGYGHLRVVVSKGFKVLAILDGDAEGDCVVDVEAGAEAHSIRSGGGPGNAICTGKGFGHAVQMESFLGEASRVLGPGAAVKTPLPCEFRRIHEDRPRFWGFIVDSAEDGSITAEAHKGSEITVVRTGEGKGDSKVSGDGVANAVREHRGDGNAERSGSGNGQAWKFGPGRGNAKRSGPGNGHAWHDGYGPGRPIREGAGRGDEIQTKGGLEKWEPYVRPEPRAEPEPPGGMDFQ